MRCNVCPWRYVRAACERVMWRPTRADDEEWYILYILELFSKHHYLSLITKHLIELIFTIAIVFKMGFSIICDVYKLINAKFSVLAGRITLSVIQNKAWTITV